MAERARIDAESPWPWLDPFTEAAATFFNGRDDDARALLRGVLATPACVLFGKSGLGKTSLLLAGLFPLLRERLLLPVFLRAEHGTAAPGLSAQLSRALDDAVASASEPLRESTGGARPGEADEVAALWERLHDRRRQLLDTTGRRWTPVFVLDQLEEIFTLQADEQRRRQGFEQLGDLIENRVPRVVTTRLEQHDDLVDRLDQDRQPYRFLLSLREDFLPELEPWADLIPRLGPNRYRLLPMSREQALDAVQKTGGALVEPSSAERIVDFLGRQTSGDEGGRILSESHRIEPALLSLVCSSLNADRLALDPPGAHLDVSDLEARGAKILDRFYDEAFAGLPEALRAQAARWVESDLITAGGTRRPFPVRAVEEALRPALRQLVDRRLLRIENTEQGDQVELVHDRLAVVASGRAQAAQRQAEAAERLQRERDASERALAEQRAQSAELAKEHAARELARTREKLTAARRIRWLAGALAIVAVGAVAIAWWANDERQRASRAELDAIELRLQAETRALEAAEALDSARALADAARELATARPTEQAEARRKLSVYATAVESQATCTVGRRIYPQIAADAERGVRDTLRRASAALQDAGFIVPRVEEVTARRMPSTTEVRYFRKEEENGALAATAALAQAGLPGVPAKYVTGYEDSTSIRPCHYELWLTDDRAGRPAAAR